jgi:hypothetical protein
MAEAGPKAERHCRRAGDRVVARAHWELRTSEKIHIKRREKENCGESVGK